MDVPNAFVSSPLESHVLMNLFFPLISLVYAHSILISLFFSFFYPATSLFTHSHSRNSISSLSLFDDFFLALTLTHILYLLAFTPPDVFLLD